MTESNWIAKSIVPKSDQLNAEDLLSGPITVTVRDVQQGSADQPIAILIDGGKQPYKPCKTMRKVLVYCWTDQASNWIGKRMTLYADPNVKWAGVAVGGIRISHLSGIDAPISLMLSETRGKRKAYTIQTIAEKGKPKESSPVLDKWRPQFVGMPADVLAMAGRIAGVKTVEAAMLIETDLIAMPDDDNRTLLLGFLADVLASLK